MADMTSSLRPMMRPEDVVAAPSSDPVARETSGGGGKGGGMAESQDQITQSMNDKKWGYFDPYTGKQVPWYIDMINGGGKNAAGEDFQGGGLTSVGLGGAIANMLGIQPYGQSRERKYGGGDFWMGGPLDQARMYQFGAAEPTPVGGGGGGGVVNSSPKPKSILDPFGGAGPTVMDPRGFEPNTQPSTGNFQTAQAAAMGLDPFGGAGPNVTGVAAERQMGLAPFGGAGTNVSGAAAERGMGLLPFGGRNLPYQTSTAEDALMAQRFGLNTEDYLMRQNTPMNPQMEDRIMGMPVQATPAQVSEPYATAAGTAQQLENNKAALQANMNRYTKAEWDGMSRDERAAAGLPVRPMDAIFAGYDNFRPISEVDRMRGFLRDKGVDPSRMTDAGVRSIYSEFLNQMRKMPRQR